MIDKEKTLLMSFLTDFTLQLVSQYQYYKYEIMIYGKSNVERPVGFRDDVNYLVNYKKENGSYPAEVQARFNEWILENRI